MPETAPSSDAIRQALDRVLASPGFTRNERLSRFLRLVVERALDGRTTELKEAVIGVEVFNRRPDYDPKLDSIVRTEAARLRARLAEYYATHGRNDSIVITIPKGSYAPAFHRLEASEALAAAGSARPRRRTLWTAAAVAVLLVAAGVAGAWALRQRSAPITLAVLPFDNLNRTPNTDYVADGLTHELIRNLAVVEGLEVRSQTSSFAFKAQPRNVHEIARELDVDYLVEGSVLQNGSRLRIDAQLVRTRDDVSLWSQRFERDASDLFNVQDELSVQIANSLRVQFWPRRRRYEVSAGAYDMYLRAQALARTEPSPSVGPPAAVMNEAVRLYEEAIARDSAFAPAYAGLASMYALESVQFPLDHPHDELTRQRLAAEKAVELDPLLAEAHAALGSMYARQGEWSEAERSFRRAIEIDPSASAIRRDYGYWVLTVQGRLDEALVQLRAAQHSDPKAPAIHQLLSLVLIYSGRYDQARQLCETAPDEVSGLECRARVLLAEDRPADAAALLSRDPSVAFNPQTRGLLGYAYARSGRTDLAKDMVTRATQPNEQALIRTGLGDRDDAFDALARMASVGPQRLGIYLNFPEFAVLRSDPRFVSLKQGVGSARER